MKFHETLNYIDKHNLKNCKKCGCFMGKSKHDCEKIQEKIRNNRPDNSGKNNPMYGKENKWGKHDKKSMRKFGLKRVGSNNPSWIDGRSYKPYPLEFKRIRYNKTIHKKYNFTCQLCGDYIPEFISHKNPFLTIHHIDYNKKNNNLNNLITLCNFCNVSVNTNRQEWIKFFKNKTWKI